MTLKSLWERWKLARVNAEMRNFGKPARWWEFEIYRGEKVKSETELRERIREYVEARK